MYSGWAHSQPDAADRSTSALPGFPYQVRLFLITQRSSRHKVTVLAEKVTDEYSIVTYLLYTYRTPQTRPCPIIFESIHSKWPIAMYLGLHIFYMGGVQFVLFTEVWGRMYNYKKKVFNCSCVLVNKARFAINTNTGIMPHDI